jgi:hypothetical protein
MFSRMRLSGFLYIELITKLSLDPIILNDQELEIFSLQIYIKF